MNLSKYYTALVFSLSFIVISCNNENKKRDTIDKTEELFQSTHFTKDSFYNISNTWKTQDDEKFIFRTYKDSFMLLTFFDTSKPIKNYKDFRFLQKIYDSLKVEKNHYAIKFVLISDDPEIDTPQAMTNFIDKIELDTKDWILLQGSVDGLANVENFLKNRFVTNDTIPIKNGIYLINPKGQVLCRIAGDSLVKKKKQIYTQINNLLSEHISYKDSLNQLNSQVNK